MFAGIDQDNSESVLGNKNERGTRARMPDWDINDKHMKQDWYLKKESRRERIKKHQHLTSSDRLATSVGFDSNSEKGLQRCQMMSSMADAACDNVAETWRAHVLENYVV
ncbi:hypothetical protein B9Z55_001174 [Caenorhabditis nigoni]|uniref:Uncharacterized protein n=1 Tax=Caenorhabditis nigoni TaxID=1611254 RepID=A0A2G5VEI2_9PELO|nr:hypothetical protein B9Z55_001174 [Caenorhabditis nigoni]